MSPDERFTGNPRELRPRQYAAHILRLETLEERREAFNQVPEHLREMVRKHAQNSWHHIQQKRATWTEN